MEITEKPKFTNWSGEAVSKREAISDRLDYIIDSFIKPHGKRDRSDEAKALTESRIEKVTAILETAESDYDLEKIIRNLNKHINDKNPTAVIDTWISDNSPING